MFDFAPPCFLAGAADVMEWVFCGWTQRNYRGTTEELLKNCWETSEEPHRNCWTPLRTTEELLKSSEEPSDGWNWEELPKYHKESAEELTEQTLWTKIKASTKNVTNLAFKLVNLPKYHSKKMFIFLKNWKKNSRTSFKGISGCCCLNLQCISLKFDMKQTNGVCPPCLHCLSSSYKYNPLLPRWASQEG